MKTGTYVCEWEPLSRMFLGLLINNSKLEGYQIWYFSNLLHMCILYHNNWPRVKHAYLRVLDARAWWVKDARICGTNFWWEKTRARWPRVICTVPKKKLWGYDARATWVNDARICGRNFLWEKTRASKFSKFWKFF